MKQISIPKGGVSAARQGALEEATADYVMFCDADDLFFNACGLWMVFREIETAPFKFLVSAFVEETRTPLDKKTPVFVTHNIDFTFVHGKVANRKFLKDNTIAWNPNLTIHEDSYFNMMCAKVAKEVKHCQQPFYLWKWRDDSVCRHDPKYMLKTYRNMLESSTALVNNLKERDMLKDAAEIVVQLVFDTYFTMNKKEWINQENQEYRLATEKRFKQYYNDFKDLFLGTPEEVRNQIVIGIKNRMFQEGVILESITFDDWMKHIEAL